ncbi:membrane protein [Mycoplasma wenyonii str. Massachusetts]|uniref:Membrane protein n=1 Tax=Mycoplasma wenyonii (strain Massachusetts) TaxID=1197325 RepID=I6ZEJ8_MYCWM|nr:hypothetical protein [Mycoplasma wenyonii]AFN65017.1 membrane protein [Mycoplasma wenyonii str. Massachusetts]
MDSYLSLVAFFFFLFAVVTYKYRLPGLFSCLFLTIGCGSIYSIFLLSGLTRDKSTLFALLALLFFSISNSLHFFSWIKRYLRTNNYTVRMAIYLANKKHNVYLYELALMLLIPSSLFIFLLPPSLKEMGIVLALGALFIFAVWFLFSNFYLPRLGYLGEKKQSYLFSDYVAEADKERATLTYSNLIRELRSAGKQSTLKDEIKKRKASIAPLDFAPLVFLLGTIGFILWLSKCGLNYPSFFKNNKLLSFDKGVQEKIKSSMDGLKEQIKELKNNVSETVKGKLASSSSWFHYLIPESVDISKILAAFKGENGKTTLGDKTNWHIQETEAFSVMPSLEKTISLIFFSLIPLTIYNLFRFGTSSAISLTLSTVLFLGSGYLSLLSGYFLKVPELFPQLILATFFVLLGFWTMTILNAKEESKYSQSEEKDRRLVFQYQARGIKAELKREIGFYSLAFSGVAIFALAAPEYDLVYAFVFFLFLVLCISLFFVPMTTCLWSNLRLLKDRYYYHLVGFFVREKNRLQEYGTEEENVMGINY